MALELDIDISFKSDSKFEDVFDSPPPAKKRKEAMLLPEAGIILFYVYVSILYIHAITVKFCNKLHLTFSRKSLTM